MPDWSRISEKAGGLLRNRRGLTVDFAWKDGVFCGIRSSLRREDVASDAGLAGEYVFSLLCDCRQFCGVYPESHRDTIVMEGESYRVLSIEKDPTGATVRLNLGGIWS